MVKQVIQTCDQQLHTSMPCSRVTSNHIDAPVVTIYERWSIKTSGKGKMP
jgi:hypothetical protein